MCVCSRYVRGATVRKRKSRANQTEKAKQNERENNKAGLRKTRADQTVEEKKTEREKSKAGMRKTRADQTVEEKKTERENKTAGMRKSRAQKQADQFYTKEELEELDAAGPQPVSEQQRQAVMRAAYDAFHQPAVACAVCDQFRQENDCGEYLPEELPDSLFSALIPSSRATPLPDGLRAYYDVSAMFPAPAVLGGSNRVADGPEPNLLNFDDVRPCVQNQKLRFWMSPLATRQNYAS